MHYIMGFIFLRDKVGYLLLVNKPLHLILKNDRAH
jgi:hypothetical protein